MIEEDFQHERHGKHGDVQHGSQIFPGLNFEMFRDYKIDTSYFDESFGRTDLFSNE